MSDITREVRNHLPVTPACCFDAEGSRIGIVTCKLCGAALLLDPRDTVDVIKLHVDFHNSVMDSLLELSEEKT